MWLFAVPNTKAWGSQLTWSIANPTPFTRATALSESLEPGPQRLVVHLVVELDLGALDQRAQQARAAIGRGLLQIGVLPDHVLAKQRCRILATAEVLNRGVD